MTKKSSLKGKKILITSGPTWVAIDSMRVISNRSSGRMGRCLTSEFVKNKARVTLIEGPVTKALVNKNVRIKKYKFFNELESLLKNELKQKYDIVVHAAAVSDYKPETASRQKIRSDKETLTLRLRPTRKLINLIRKKAKQSLLVGFKLETSLAKTRAYSAARKIFKEAACDFVIVNSLGKKKYKGFILDDSGRVLSSGKSRGKIARSLVKHIKGAL